MPENFFHIIPFSISQAFLKVKQSKCYERKLNKYNALQKSGKGDEIICDICSSGINKNEILRCRICRIVFVHLKCIDFEGVTEEGFFCHTCRKTLRMVCFY